jgi:hypothetical protein
MSDSTVRRPRFREITDSMIKPLLIPLSDQIPHFEQLTTPAELKRIAATCSRIPKAHARSDHIADIGGSLLWLPLYRTLLGYTRISLIQFPEYLAGTNYDERRIKSEFGCDFVPADADRCSYGIESHSVTCVTCFELLEHLVGDPMHMVSEANRMLVDSGTLYLTTPNVLHDYNLVTLMFGGHPYGWSVYTRHYGDRHNREYTPFELIELLNAGGFEMDAFETLTYLRRGSLQKRIAAYLLCLIPAISGHVPLNKRGAFSHYRGHKTSPVRSRYPEFLYDLMGADKVN